MRLKQLTPRRCAAVLAMIACGVLLAPSAAASQATIASAVFKDYQSDADITACLFTEAQLKSLKVGADFDSYSPDLKNEINKEIARWRNGGCSGKAKNGLRIVTAKGKGSARKEYVTIKNAGRKSVKLGGYALRDHARKKIRLPSIRLAKGRTLRVITACAKGKHKPSRKGSRYYACRKTGFWNDTRDVVELLSPSGKVLARKRTT